MILQVESGHSNAAKILCPTDRLLCSTLADESPLPPLPAHRRIRADGWTHDRLVTFCVTLAASDNVTFAGASVGLSGKSACALKKRDPAFAALWDRCLAGAKAARLNALRKAAKGDEVYARPNPSRPINFVNSRRDDWGRGNVA